MAKASTSPQDNSNWHQQLVSNNSEQSWDPMMTTSEQQQHRSRWRRLDRWWRWYKGRLQGHPVSTKSVVAAVVSAVGVVLQMAGSTAATTGSGSRSSSRAKQQQTSDHRHVDWMDVLSFALYGGLIGGPLTHYWNDWLDDHHQDNDNDDEEEEAGWLLSSKSMSMLIDQLIVQPPLLFLMHVFLDMSRAALLEAPQAWNRALRRTGPSVVLSWRFWPVVVYLILRLLKRRKHATVAMQVAGAYWMSQVANLRSNTAAVSAPKMTHGIGP